MRRQIRAALYIFLAVLATAAPASAIEVYDLNSTPNHNNLFTNSPTFPTPLTPNTDPNFLDNGVDYSGLVVGTAGSYGTRGGALITPLNVVIAYHRYMDFTPDVVYTAVSFADGTSYTVDQSKTVRLNYPGTSTPSDLAVLTLTTPVPSTTARPFAIMAPDPVTNDYRFAQIHVVGPAGTDNTQTIHTGPSVGLANIDLFEHAGSLTFFQNPTIQAVDDGSGITAAFEYGYVPGTHDLAGVISGDSSDPSFLMYNGQAALIGIHLANDASGGVPAPNTSFNSVDAYLPDYIDQIDAAIADTGFQVAVVPEPNAGLLLALGGIVLIVFRWRSGRGKHWSNAANATC